MKKNKTVAYKNTNWHIKYSDIEGVKVALSIDADDWDIMLEESKDANLESKLLELL